MYFVLIILADADDEDFYNSLSKARKAPAIESVAAAVEAAAARRRQEEANAPPSAIIEYDDDDDDEDEDGPKKAAPLVMSSTSEFVRNIHIAEERTHSVPVIKTEPGVVCLLLLKFVLLCKLILLFLAIHRESGAQGT